MSHRDCNGTKTLLLLELELLSAVSRYSRTLCNKWWRLCFLQCKLRPKPNLLYVSIIGKRALCHVTNANLCRRVVLSRLGSARLRLGLHRLIQKQTSQAKPSHEQWLAGGLAVFSRWLITFLVHGCSTARWGSTRISNAQVKSEEYITFVYYTFSETPSAKSTKLKVSNMSPHRSFRRIHHRVKL
jgi:hypothetical protein